MTECEGNKASVIRFFEIFSTGDFTHLMTMLGAEAMWTVAGRLAGVSGCYSKAQIGPLLEGTKALYTAAGLRITPLSVVADGDRVMVEAEGLAELPDGRAYAPNYCFAFRFTDGVIQAVTEYMDTHYARETFFGG